MEKDVVRLQIPVHYVVFIEDFERLQELAKYLQCLFLREPRFFFELRFKSLPITELIDKIEVVGSFEHLDKLDDVGTGLNPGKVPDLIGRALL